MFISNYLFSDFVDTSSMMNVMFDKILISIYLYWHVLTWQFCHVGSLIFFYRV